MGNRNGNGGYFCVTETKLVSFFSGINPNLESMIERIRFLAMPGSILLDASDYFSNSSAITSCTGRASKMAHKTGRRSMV